MKKTLILILTITTFGLQTLLANGIQPLSLSQQLLELNKHWQDKTDIELHWVKTSFTDKEVVLIQTHLLLVEQNLRSKKTDHLSAKQKQNRLACLDILNAYWQKGVFPQNLYHKNRTPYFIDHLGTACAVGQLIVKTGHVAFAKKVAQTNNYVYINDLEKENDGLKMWADKYGFTIAELAWIQPSYIICDPDCIQALEISAIGGIPPYTYEWSNGSTESFATDLCPGETYGCIVHDSLGNLITNVEMYFQATIIDNNTFTIPQAYPVSLFTEATHDCSCDGTATANASSSSGANLYYNWEDGQTTEIAVGLCAGEYLVTVSDGNGCSKVELATVFPQLNVQFSNTEDDGLCNGTATATIFGGTPPYTYSWSTSGQETETASDLCAGEYVLEVADANSCIITKTTTVSLLTDIVEIPLPEMLLFPNPTKDFITVRLDGMNPNNRIAVIHDMRGQLISQEKFDSDLLQVDLTSFEKGVYFISVQDGERTIRKKVVKIN